MRVRSFVLLLLLDPVTPLALHLIQLLVPTPRTDFIAPWSSPYLGDQRRVAHGGRQAYAQSLQIAKDDVGFGYEAEGTEVTHTDSCQYYKTQLSAGRFHHWGVTESEQRHIQTKKYEQKHTSKKHARI